MAVVGRFHLPGDRPLDSVVGSTRGAVVARPFLCYVSPPVRPPASPLLPPLSLPCLPRASECAAPLLALCLPLVLPFFAINSFSDHDLSRRNERFTGYGDQYLPTLLQLLRQLSLWVSTLVSTQTVTLSVSGAKRCPPPSNHCKG